MLHDVMTAAKGGELVTTTLPLFAGEKKVRAARIVALGIGAQPGQTRLALLGGAHVEVGKAWMQQQGAQVGHYYVQGQDGSNESVPEEDFEGAFEPIAEPVYDEVSGTAGEQSKDDRELSHELAHKSAVLHIDELTEQLKESGDKCTRLRHERDGARARITELEKELAAAHAKNQLIIEGTVGEGTGGEPSAEDLDKVAEENEAAEDTGGLETSEPQEQH